MSCPKYLKKGSCREAKASVLLSLLVVHNKRYSTFRCCRHFIYFACKVSKKSSFLKIRATKSPQICTALSFKIWSHSWKMCYFIAVAV